PLTPGVRSEAALPEFAVRWQVQVGSRLVAERTPFERLAVEPEPSYYGSWGVNVGLGTRPVWWYDPLFYPGIGFYSAPIILEHRLPVVPRYAPPPPVRRV